MHPEKRRPFPGVLYLAPVERFTAAPCAGNAIDIIVNAVFNAFNFKAIQAAVICDTFPAFTILSFIHRFNPFQKSTRRIFLLLALFGIIPTNHAKIAFAALSTAILEKL